MQKEVVNPWEYGGRWFYRKLRRYWFEYSVGLILFYLFAVRDVDVQLKIGGKPVVEVTESVHFLEKPEDEKLSVLPKFPEPGNDKNSKASSATWKSSDFGNLTFILNPDLAYEKGVPASIVEQKFTICLDYVRQNLDNAKRSARAHQIPVSITLAQALLESNAGMSKLALQSNNHFGIKCKRKCLGCTCRNYADDDKYDMFRVFETAEESFEAHARLLGTNRYAHLKKYGNDYRKWARGLKKAGYATDKAYAEKLIRIIETLKLYQYDGNA
ncbi:MAG: mannosyl-glycoprotein endo-beta-N-acetylglucosamidase [Saprospirales bacterium]|nr:mannosyl-glycoprotein endo-beta-N-acetylglucosamidase [Saprospirales bacterium]